MEAHPPTSSLLIPWVGFSVKVLAPFFVSSWSSCSHIQSTGLQACAIVCLSFYSSIEATNSPVRRYFVLLGVKKASEGHDEVNNDDFIQYWRNRIKLLTHAYMFWFSSWGYDKILFPKEIFGGEKGFISLYNFRSQSIIKGSQGRNL